MNQVLLPNIKKEVKTFIVTANPEIVEYANKNSEYKRIISSADYIVADGIGVILASKLINDSLPERIPGYEMMLDLFQHANDQALKVFLLGAEPSVIETAVDNLKKEYSNINIVGYHHGYMDMKDSKIAKNIQALKPDLIFVALGFPKQEEWIHTYYHLFNKGIFIGVGGSFDVLAGKVKRAPLIWQKLNLEWFYRLIKQPSRWKRMLVLPKFVLDVWKEKRKTK